MMTTPHTIRIGNSGDITSIANFQLAMALETEQKHLNLPTVLTAVREVIEDKNKGFYLVCLTDEKVAGSLLITYEWSDWRNTNIWYFQSVYILPEYRGRGFFKAMYQETVAQASEAGTKRIRLYVENDNLKAQQVYENLGMKLLPYRMYEAEI